MLRALSDPGELPAGNNDPRELARPWDIYPVAFDGFSKTGEDSRGVARWDVRLAPLYDISSYLPYDDSNVFARCVFVRALAFT